jgi:hypothetical protein
MVDFLFYAAKLDASVARRLKGLDVNLMTDDVPHQRQVSIPVRKESSGNFGSQNGSSEICRVLSPMHRQQHGVSCRILKSLGKKSFWRGSQHAERTWEKRWM